MTTENTDAAARILTKTIRKLTEQLAEADGSIRYEEGKRKEAEGRLADIRKALDPQPKGLNGLAEIFTQTLGQLVSGDYQTTEDLAVERMAELAEARAENQKRVAQVDERLVEAGARMADLEGRIEQAVEALDDGREPLSAIVAILRGEA